MKIMGEGRPHGPRRGRITLEESLYAPTRLTLHNAYLLVLTYSKKKCKLTTYAARTFDSVEESGVNAYLPELMYSKKT